MLGARKGEKHRGVGGQPRAWGRGGRGPPQGSQREGGRPREFGCWSSLK